MSSFSYTTATGLSEAVGGQISHDKTTRCLSETELNSKQFWGLVKPVVRTYESDDGMIDGMIIFDDGSIEKVDELSDTIKKKGFLVTVRYHHEKPWIQLYVEEPENTAYYVQEISKIFPNKGVVGLGTYTVSDSVIFCEFKDGEIIRLLQSGFERELEWEKIEGTPQPWESDILEGRKLEIGSPGMASYDIHKIGEVFNMPGFGVPKAGEAWSKEILN